MEIGGEAFVIIYISEPYRMFHGHVHVVLMSLKLELIFDSAFLSVQIQLAPPPVIKETQVCLHLINSIIS